MRLFLVLAAALISFATPFAVFPSGRAFIVTAAPKQTCLFCTLEKFAEIPLENMRAKDAKAELKLRGVPCASMLEKETLIEALKIAREKNTTKSGGGNEANGAGRDMEAAREDGNDGDSDSDSDVVVVSDDNGQKRGGAEDIEFEDVEIVNDGESGGSGSSNKEDMFGGFGGMANMANLASMFTKMSS